MLVVSGSGCPVAEGESFRADLAAAHGRSPSGPGTSTARSVATSTTPSCGCSRTRWENVGAYRRALSSYDVKLQAVPLLSRAVDEPSAYEVVEPGTVLNIESTRSLG